MVDLLRIFPVYRRLREENEQLRNRVKYGVVDELTELPNKYAFKERLGEEYERTKRLNRRKSPRSLSVAFGDINGFKNVNDRLGHANGDKAVRAVAHQLRARIRPYDFVARWGGDEYAFLFPETGSDIAVSIVKRLILHEYLIETQDGAVSLGLRMRFGLGTWPEWPAASPEQLFDDVSTALVRARQAESGIYVLR